MKPLLPPPAAVYQVYIYIYMTILTFRSFCRAAVSFHYVIRSFPRCFLLGGQGAFYILSYPLVEFLNQGSSKLLTFDNEVFTQAGRMFNNNVQYRTFQSERVPANTTAIFGQMAKWMWKPLLARTETTKKNYRRM